MHNNEWSPPFRRMCDPWFKNHIRVRFKILYGSFILVDS
jgi:hypothetical protein